MWYVLGLLEGSGRSILPRPDSESVAMIGLGVQARTQAMALKQELPNLKEILGFDIVKERGLKTVREIEENTGISAKFVDTAKDAVKDADVITTVTLADEPIVKDAWVKSGSLFIHVGSYVEEEYAVVLGSSKIVVDDWETVKHRKTPILARMYDEGVLKIIRFTQI